MFDEKIDLSQPVFAIVNEFDLAAHVERMRIRHPRWSQRQLACCLYWQPRARKELATKISEFLRGHRGYLADCCPEAGGVNVTATLANLGVALEWPPRKTVCQVAIAGLPRDCKLRTAGYQVRLA
jgi:hypothetical protein